MLALLLPLLGPSLPADTSEYWQQHVTYAIAAHLDEPSGVLTGHERLVYVNRSPDTLHDFYVQQYLNAFRPGSRWAMSDSAEGVVRFQHLKDPDYAFERFTRVVIDGAERRADYPGAPDSTVAHWTLARPLAPGDSLVAEFDWQARVSTVPRRQGREGRRFDFAQWYPKVSVYDKYGWEAHALYPAGEFYGEFATYDVVLDLAQDQVIGATGVPEEGDPGWERARRDPTIRVDYQADWYRRTGGRADRRTVGCSDLDLAPGRKCVHFHAEDVHHFAFSLNPEYVYEQGRYGDVVVHVLYLPADTASWGKGVAVQWTEIALQWLDQLFGPDQWPQLTNVHRIEGGGTEFPMMEMNGGATLGVILHESGHQYVMGQLANNEWREAWLDEGFTSFQSGWFLEEHHVRRVYEALEPQVLWLDLGGWSQPISMISEQYRDFFTYNEMVYAKAQLFYEQLRYVVGDSTMRVILRTYFDRWKLKHVDETAFKAVCEEVSHRDLDWLFAQWLHADLLIDYRLEKVERHELPDGHWHTVVTITRRAPGVMPVEIGDADTIYARASGQPEVERVEFTTARKPGRLMLDPRLRAHDFNMLNNREKRGLEGRGSFETKIDNPLRETVRRDRLVDAWMPVAWYNDVGGVTVGLRSRTNYFGSYDRNLLIGTVGTKSGASDPVGVYARFSNPVSHPMPHVTTSAAGWYVEGRAGVDLEADRSLQQSPDAAADPHVGFGLLWMATTTLDYLDRRLWDDAGTVELGPTFSTTVEKGRTVFAARTDLKGGVAYSNPGPGLATGSRYDVGGYARLTAEASLRKPFWLGTRLGARLFGGGYLGGSGPIKQRRIMVSGADPYTTFTNPFMRSAGALFVRPDFHYQSPGDANLRGYRPDLGGRWAAALNFEVTRSVISGEKGVVRDVSLEAFLDGALVDSLATSPNSGGKAYSDLWDGGLGLVTRQRTGDLDWTVRVEFPLAMNAWHLAPDAGTNDGRVAFRWVVSLAPSF
ncbi:MAG TPA: M1 family metallopeptidase [Gemmatimonadales bacterium]|nr:M1 family metallopeptidase [Gemmatimonadales bacterium]